MGLLNRKKKNIKDLPEVLAPAPKDPVNYNSVLDYLVGLSNKDYDKICKITDIYRKAHAEAAVIYGVKDQPTTVLKPTKPSDDEIDRGLDEALDADELVFLPGEGEPMAPEPAKEQAPARETKIDIQG